MKMTLTTKKRNHGFTLMELMIVIVIIGVLASFALPNFRNTINRSQCNDARAQLIALHGANAIYRAQNDEYLPGAAINTAAINAGLHVNLIESAYTYSYTRSDTTHYAVTASRTSPVNTITMDEDTIVPTGAGANPSSCP